MWKMSRGVDVGLPIALSPLRRPNVVVSDTKSPSEMPWNGQNSISIGYCLTYHISERFGSANGEAEARKKP